MRTLTKKLKCVEGSIDVLPEHQEWLRQLKEEGQALMWFIKEEVSYEKLEQALQRFADLLKTIQAELSQLASIDEGKEEWQAIHYHFNRIRRMIEVKAPRLILEYELKWLQVKLHQFEQQLKGEPSQMAGEEARLKDSDLYNL